MRILIISGSLRRGSLNRRLAAAAQDQLSSEHDAQLWLGLGDLPFFNEDLEDDEATAVRSIRDAVGAADALIVVTPEYNSSVPGVLKNALDWLSRPRAEAALSGKPTLVLGASPSPSGAAQARQDATRILARSGAAVSDTSFGVSSAWRAFADADPTSNGEPGAAGQLTDDAVRAGLAAALRDFLAEAAQPASLAG